jgi:hypothetical protein
VRSTYGVPYSRNPRTGVVESESESNSIPEVSEVFGGLGNIDIRVKMCIIAVFM